MEFILTKLLYSVPPEIVCQSICYAKLGEWENVIKFIPLGHQIKHAKFCSVIFIGHKSEAFSGIVFFYLCEGIDSGT